MSSVVAEATPRVAVVTGAGTGIGRGIALELAKLGWPVAIGGRREERLVETAEAIATTAGKAFVHVLDVTDAESVETFFAAVEAELGPVDVLVNNAGMSMPMKIQESDPADIERVIATNTIGALYCTRRAVRSMLAADADGDVVFISSDTVEIPVPRNAVYGASKAALENASRAFNMEFEGTGIRSTVVRLGPTTSEFGFGWDPEKTAELVAFWNEYHFYHSVMLEPADVGRGVVATVTTPPSVHLNTVWVTPRPPRGEVVGVGVTKPEDLA